MSETKWTPERITDLLKAVQSAADELGQPCLRDDLGDMMSDLQKASGKNAVMSACLSPVACPAAELAALRAENRRLMQKVAELEERIEEMNWNSMGEDL